MNKTLTDHRFRFGNAVDYFGDVDNPNAFSKQLLQNIVDRSQNPAVLRIGGNTQDRASFCENCTQTMSSIVLNDPNDPKGTEAVKVTFNKNLFNVLMDNVPAGTPIIFGLNFRNSMYSFFQMDGLLTVITTPQTATAWLKMRSMVPSSTSTKIW